MIENESKNILDEFFTSETISCCFRIIFAVECHKLCSQLISKHACTNSLRLQVECDKLSKFDSSLPTTVNYNNNCNYYHFLLDITEVITYTKKEIIHKIRYKFIKN